MRQSPRARLLLGALIVFSFSGSICTSGAQQAPQSQQPTTKPVARPAASTPPGQVNPALSQPTGPQPTHFPILLLVEGKDLSWSIRIGQKGPERMDRNGYPTIPLEPGAVVREGPDIWTYKAEDAQTGAAVAVHLTRGNCADDSSTTKYGFTATVEHAQIGALQGCARIATELFPRINNQPTDDDDDTKEKPTPPTVTHFKPPVDVAYVTDTGRMIVKHGSAARAVPGKAGDSLCLSHDGQKLLFVRDEQPAGVRTIDEFDFETRHTAELIRGNVGAAFWSPDDTRIAFLENVNGKWQVWSMPAGAPEKAAALYAGEEISLEGWTDAHTVLAGDLQTFSWIGDDGTVKQTLTSADLYGKDEYGVTSGNAVRVHPLTPDLLLVSAELLPAAAAEASKEATRKQTEEKDAAGKDTSKMAPVTMLPGPAFFTYEIRSKRRVLLSPPNLLSNDAEWSDDGLQIFFTGHDAVGKAATIYRVFWDGTSLVKVHEGYDYAIGR